MRLRHEWVVRMDYGAIAPWVRRREIHGEEVITAVAGPDKLVLRGPRLPIAHGHRHVDEFAVEAGDELTFSMTWIPSYDRTPASSDLPIEASIAADAAWAAQCHDDVPHVGRRAPVAAHAPPDDPRADGRHRRLPDHLAARGLRRRAELGLPLLLAARRRPDHRVADRRRIHRRGEVLAALAAAFRGRRPGRPPDHVHRRRRSAPARAHPRPPPRVLRVAAGEDRQRRRGAAADRRPRRADDRAVRRARRGAGGRRRRLEPPAQPGQPARRDLAGAGPRHLGDPRAQAPVHPLTGDGVGGVRPSGPRRGGRGPRGTRRPLARGARRRLRGDHVGRVRRAAQHLHPARRDPGGGRLSAGAPARGLREGRRPAGCSGPSRPSRRT